jgi:hypothetical protein
MFTRKIRNIVVAAVIAVTAFSLTACGKEVDKNITKATKVNGTYNLYWFCDGTTLIYFEDSAGGDDEYVALFSWGCTEKGEPTKELPGTLGDGNGGDTSNK